VLLYFAVFLTSFFIFYEEEVMMRSRMLRARLACVLAVSMLFGTNTAQLFAAEPDGDEVVFEADADAEIEAEADVEEVSEVSGM